MVFVASFALTVASVLRGSGVVRCQLLLLALAGGDLGRSSFLVDVGGAPVSLPFVLERVTGELESLQPSASCNAQSFASAPSAVPHDEQRADNLQPDVQVANLRC